MGIRDAINAIEARLLKETPIYDEESAQRLNTRELSDVRRVLFHELKNNPQDYLPEELSSSVDSDESFRSGNHEFLFELYRTLQNLDGFDVNLVTAFDEDKGEVTISFASPLMQKIKTPYFKEFRLLVNFNEGEILCSTAALWLFSREMQDSFISKIYGALRSNGYRVQKTKSNDVGILSTYIQFLKNDDDNKVSFAKERSIKNALMNLIEELEYAAGYRENKPDLEDGFLSDDD